MAGLFTVYLMTAILMADGSRPDTVAHPFSSNDAAAAQQLCEDAGDAFVDFAKAHQDKFAKFSWMCTPPLNFDDVNNSPADAAPPAEKKKTGRNEA